MTAEPEETAPRLRLADVPVGRITRRARSKRARTVTIEIIAALLMAPGWAAYKIVSVVWFILAWSMTAVAEGWRTAAGRPTPGGPTREELLAENTRLRHEISRLS